MKDGKHIKGKLYRWLVLKVTDTDLDGRPRGVTCMFDQDHTNVRGGEQFWIVLAPEEMCKPTRDMPEV